MHALVGGLNTARSLTTGIVTMQREALLNYHTDPCGESITVLEGEVEVSVEGRTYLLGPLDNVTIPRWLPHQVQNIDSGKPARLHIALATSVWSKAGSTPCATAMIPRGLVHHFINVSEHLMDMIWVDAAPMPERIVLEPGFVRVPVA